MITSQKLIKCSKDNRQQDEISLITYSMDIKREVVLYRTGSCGIGEVNSHWIKRHQYSLNINRTVL